MMMQMRYNLWCQQYINIEIYYKYLLAVLSNSKKYDKLEDLLKSKRKLLKIEDYRDMVLRQEAQTALLKNIKAFFIKKIDFYSYISRTFLLNIFIYIVSITSSIIICYNSIFYFNYNYDNISTNAILISKIFYALIRILAYFFDTTNYYPVLLQVSIIILFIDYLVLFLFLMIYIPTFIMLILYGAIKNIRLFVSILTIIIGLSIISYIIYIYSLYDNILFFIKSFLHT